MTKNYSAIFFRTAKKLLKVKISLKEKLLIFKNRNIGASFAEHERFHDGL